MNTCLFFSGDEMRSTLLCSEFAMAVSRKTLVWLSFYFTERVMDQIWLFRVDYLVDFLSKLQNEPVTLRKTIIFVTNDKIQTCKQKLDFRKSWILHHKLELESLKALLMRALVILTNAILVLYNEMCQYLGDLYNSVSQHSSNDQLQNHT